MCLNSVLTYNFVFVNFNELRAFSSVAMGVLQSCLKKKPLVAHLLTFKRRLYSPRRGASAVLSVRQNASQKDMKLSGVPSSRVSLTIMPKLLPGSNFCLHGRERGGLYPDLCTLLTVTPHFMCNTRPSNFLLFLSSRRP
jgi:hypothetical protein